MFSFLLKIAIIALQLYTILLIRKNHSSELLNQNEEVDNKLLNQNEEGDNNALDSNLLGKPIITDKITHNNISSLYNSISNAGINGKSSLNKEINRDIESLLMNKSSFIDNQTLNTSDIKDTKALLIEK